MTKILIDTDLTLRAYYKGRLIKFNREQLNEKYEITLPSEGVPTGVSIEWYRDDVHLSQFDDSYYIQMGSEYLEPGSYYVRVIISSGILDDYPNGVIIQTATTIVNPHLPE